MTANHPTHAGKFYLTKPVFFIGFMGAGKTSISQQIAVTCGVASIDADEYLSFAKTESLPTSLPKTAKRHFAISKLMFCVTWQSVLRVLLVAVAVLLPSVPLTLKS